MLRFTGAERGLTLPPSLGSHSHSILLKTLSTRVPRVLYVQSHRRNAKLFNDNLLRICHQQQSLCYVVCSLESCTHQPAPNQHQHFTHYSKTLVR